MKITGSILKEARERKNITLNEVAYATKINLRALQAIEGGDIAALPPKAFVRGFVQVYAEYLKLDVPSIMIQFQEEMGSTKPVFADTLDTNNIKPISNVQSPGQVVLDSRGVEEEMKEGSSSLVKMSIFVTAILVVAVAIVAQKTFKKYENEKVGGDSSHTSTMDPGSPTSTLQGTPSASVAVGDATKAVVDLGKATTTTLSTNSSALSGLLSSATTSTSLTTTTIRTTTTTSRPTTTSTTPTPPAVKAEEGAAPKAPATTPTSEPAKAAAPVTSSATSTEETERATTTTLASVPQEVILEALDQVDVTFRIDSGSSQTLNLKPNQIHTFKAKGKIQLEVSDGGAVNIIHNGQDRGVPGTLGQSLKLRYP